MINRFIAIMMMAVVFLGYKGVMAKADWNGAYVGVQAQIMEFDVDWKNPGTPEQDLDGVLAGVLAGYDVQFGNFVVGGIVDANFGEVSDFKRDGNYIVESGEITSTGSFRLRAGVALSDNLLIYGTGGVAWVRMEQTQICTGPPAARFGFCFRNGPFNLSATETLWGPTYGGGLEWKLGNVGWSDITLFAEYLQTEYGDQNFKMAPDANGNPLPDQIVQNMERTFKVGFKFYF